MNSGKKAFIPSADVSQKRLVTLAAAGTISHHDGVATTMLLGATDYSCPAGEHCMVTLANCQGSIEGTAAGAFDAGDKLYAAADGKIQGLPASAGTYLFVGYALGAASGDGSIVEWMPCASPVAETVS